LTLLPMVLASYLRIVTNSKVFSDPDSIGDAMNFLDVLLETPGAEVGQCGQEWAQFRDRLLSLGLKGNFVTDAWIASATQSLSEHLVTFDRDFLRLLPVGDLTVLT